MNRDYKVFEDLYQQYYAKLVVFASSILYDREEAKDIVQEVFYHLWDNAETIHTQTSLSNYLYTAVKNHALNKIKHLQIRDAHQEQIREAFLIAGEIGEDNREEIQKKMYQIIDEMPIQMKKVILLKVSNEATYAEISEALGISLNTVKTHLKRAFDILRNRLITVIALLSFFGK